jgi:hypothetical protein
MREYLFRGKRKDNGEWVSGSLIQDKWEPEKVMITGIPLLDHGCSDCGAPVLENLYWVIPETVGQFTGLMDSEKKKLFGGDIFRDEDEGILYLIEWDDHDLLWTARSLDESGDIIGLGEFSEKQITIAGNIHDTPELLGRKGKEEQNG